MLTFLRHRAPITLAVLVFVPVACFEKDCGPKEIDCEGDRSCPAGSICRMGTDGCGETENVCIAVTECSSDADCPDGDPCVFRAGDSAEHPFEREVDARGVCGCDEEGTCRPFEPSATGSGGGASSGGVGGESTQQAVSIGASTIQSGAGGEGTSGATVSIGSAGGNGGNGGDGGHTGTTGTGGNGGAGGSVTGAGGATSEAGAGGAGGTP